MALTPKTIVRLLREPGKHHDGHGLYLLVPPRTGDRPPAASWGLRYQRHGKEHLHGLGPLHVVGLKEARERAQATRLMLLNGVDPIERKRADREQRMIAAARAMTFADAARAFHQEHQHKWRNPRHRSQYLTTLEQYAWPIIGALPVASIDVPLVLKVLEQKVDDDGPLWTARSQTAARLRGRIEAILDWAKARGHRQGDNPADWDVLNKVLAQPKAAINHAAIPYVDIPEFMSALRDRPGTAFRALEFLILTAARTAEVLKMTWGEVDLTTKCWTIAAGRMKAAKEHRVPLSDRCLAILRDLPREDGNEFVFIGTQAGRGLSPMMLLLTLNRLRSGLTVHGFRSTFRTWAAEQTDHPREVAEQALAHAVGSQVERAYARTSLFDARRSLMAAWAKYCV
jgi:integrase